MEVVTGLEHLVEMSQVAEIEEAFVVVPFGVVPLVVVHFVVDIEEEGMSLILESF